RHARLRTGEQRVVQEVRPGIGKERQQEEEQLRRLDGSALGHGESLDRPTRGGNLREGPESGPPRSCSDSDLTLRAVLDAREWQRSYVRISRTTRAFSTPVNLTSSPRNGYVSRSWSMPRQCRIVAWRSRTCTGSAAML